MDDTARAWLDKFVDGRHLSDAALATAAARYAGRTPGWVALDGFLQARLSTVLGRFLARDVEFTTGLGTTTRYGYATAAEFAAASPEQRLFRYGRLEQVGARASRTPGLRAYAALSRAFSDDRMRAVFERICGQPLGRVTLSARRMGASDFLADHTDDIEGRALSWVIYLTPGWEPRFGGILELDGPGGRRAEIVPLHGRIVVFDARAWHRVTPLTEAAGDRARYTFGGWYLKPAPPPGATW
ncbi:MAG: hypothetical protein CSA66_00280 [Proteobacteria bacterium]|nr:MAG: hypothetical protein CSA66_00280 [Pseudomonadota bacterium]